MNSTKTGLRQRIALPEEAIEVLRWHERTQLVTDEQRASELLFPTAAGGFRSEHVLRKPFAQVAAILGLPLRFTPHGMRRTFNDLARTAQVADVVTRSISGHLTERMPQHTRRRTAASSARAVPCSGGAPSPVVVPRRLRHTPITRETL